MDTGLVVVERRRLDLVRWILGAPNAARSRLAQWEFLPRPGSRTVRRRSRRSRALTAGSARALCAPCPRSTFSNIMKSKHLRLTLATLCVINALVGCTSTNRRVAASALDDKNLQRAEAPPAPALSQPVILDERALRGLDLNADGVITPDERQHFDTSAGAKKNLSALDENGDGQINAAEFLTQVPRHSKRYHFFGDTNKTDDSNVSSDNEVFQQRGWPLFSFHF